MYVITEKCICSYRGGSVTVGTGSVYVTGVSGVHRTGDYSYVSVKANSVYPTEDKKDNYTTCKVRLYQNDGTSTAISYEYTVKEGTGCAMYFATHLRIVKETDYEKHIKKHRE